MWGGHGYVKENGMEQIARDARIATLYEGTTGVQALDLLGRKVCVFVDFLMGFLNILVKNNYSGKIWQN